MHILRIAVTFIFLALTGLSCATEAPAPAAAQAPTAPGKTLYHVVSFKYKESATPDQIKQVDAAFAALKTKIPGILSLNYGDNVSVEKHDNGYKQCFVLTFPTAKDRDGYLVHPAHKAFGQLVGPVLADVMVIDFWANQ
jgi:hypothetical protein